MTRLKFLLLALSLCVVTGTAGTSHAQSLRRATIYIQNPTSVYVNFSYKMGGDDWKKRRINSGYTLTMAGIADHYIAYNNGKGKVIQYKLAPGSTNYFSWSQGILSLRHR